MNEEIGHSQLTPTSNVSTSLEPFTPLPIELVRWILEIAAKGDKVTSLALALVSKAVHKWITPIIYHTVVLSEDEDVEYFLRTLRASKPNVGGSVRLLMTIRDIKDPEKIVEIVCGCTQLESVFTDVFLMDAEHLDKIGTLSFPVLWHMMVTNIKYKFTAPLDHTLLRNITHFYIDLLHDTPSLKHLPCLTHLGFGCWTEGFEADDYAPQITSLLSESSLSLVIILLLAYQEDGDPTNNLFGNLWQELAQMEDERLFAGCGLNEDDYIELLRSGGTIWDDAEIRYKNWRDRVDPDGEFY